ncbi:hypothetical protein [Hymenobacter koreensis]|uniref:Rod shape-determining protein MreD n=1 Tax=Hymenobacter koreensis TaxID=1084523 RepID=A0ABP8JF86_9BACT
MMQGLGTVTAQVLRFLVYVLVHMLIVSRLPALFGLGWSFFYIGFVLFLPIATPVVLLLVLSFVTGFALDVFYDTGGVHAAAAVLLGYLRPWVLRLLTPRDGYDAQDSVNIHQMGWQWYLVYTVLLLGIHHAAFFFLELGSLRTVGVTLLKVLVSTIFTGLTLLIIQLVFFPARRRR